MDQLDRLLDVHHGVVTTAELRRAGISKHALANAESGGRLHRVRQGVYCAIDRPLSDLSVARMAGGNLTCVSALEHCGLWVPTRTPHVHLRLSRKRATNWHRSEVRRRFAAHHLVHVVNAAPNPDGAIDTAAAAIVAASQCFGRDDLAAVIESAIRHGMTYEEAQGLGRAGNARLREALTRVDPNPLADSGLETLVRLRLEACRVRLRQQVWLHGWPVDFLIGDRLVVEVDGYAYHSDPVAFERDRRKDRMLQANGYVVLRFTARDVTDRWEACEAEILHFVRARKHRW